VTAKPNILFLVHRVPFPPNRGDRVRSWQLVKWLAARAELDLATLADEPVTSETRATLQSLCRQVAIEPVGGNMRWLKAAASLASGGTATEGLFASRSLRRTIENWSRSTRYDAVVVFCSSMARYLDCRALTDVPVIVDFVDVDSQKWRDYAAKASGLKRRLFTLEGNRLCRLEQRLCRRANTVTVVSNDEADLLRKTAPDAPVRAIENGVDLDYFALSALAPSDDATQTSENSAEIVFVGALDYRANVDGVVWFCQNVWPQLRTAVPNATLTLVGRCPTPPVLALGELPGVSIAASVPDVRPYLARAAAVVAPLRIARGIQNKVLEAAAMAKPVVASPQALTGLELVDGEHAVCANSPDEWVGALVNLLSSKEKQQQIGQAARNFVELHYRWEARLAPLDDVLVAALNRGETNARITNAASARCAVAWNDG
jgi:sugar transferase (PEP-CTERM/EpsH1 system associated)